MVDGNCHLTLGGGNPVLALLINSYLAFDRTASLFDVAIGAASRLYGTSTDMVANVGTTSAVNPFSAGYVTRKDWVAAADALKPYLSCGRTSSRRYFNLSCIGSGGTGVVSPRSRGVKYVS